MRHRAPRWEGKSGFGECDTGAVPAFPQTRVMDMVRVHETATLFIGRERAVKTAKAFQAKGKRIAEAVLAERMEADRSRSVGWAVRYREPIGAWQFA